MALEHQPGQSGLTRREALRRAAAVGGTLVWTVPVVQSLSGTAVAATASTAVEGTKISNKPPRKDQPTKVLGTKVSGSELPRTGSAAGDLAALGVGVVAVGSAMRAVKKRRGEGESTPTA